MNMAKKEVIDEYLNNNDVDTLARLLDNNQYVSSTFYENIIGGEDCIYDMTVHNKEYRDEAMVFYISNEVLRRKINPFKLLPYLIYQDEAVALYFNKFYNPNNFGDEYKKLYFTSEDSDIRTKKALTGIPKEKSKVISSSVMEEEIADFTKKVEKSIDSKRKYVSDEMCKAIVLYNLKNEVVSFNELDKIATFARLSLEKIGYFPTGEWSAGKTFDRYFCPQHSSILSKHGNCYYFRKSKKLEDELNRVIPEEFKFQYKEKPREYYSNTDEEKKARRKEMKKQKVLSFFRRIH